jgi:hypothetical protein
MPTGTFEYRTDGERIAIERAVAFVAQLHDLAQTAPAGQLLAACEAQAVTDGRALLRATLQEAVQAGIATAEAKKGRRGPARAGAGSAAKGSARGRS